MPANSWEPVRSKEGLPRRSLKRVQNDIAQLVNNPPPGIMAVPDEEDMKLMHVLIIGPDGTPYEGGMFYFLVGITHNYPMTTPKVKLITTGNREVQFNPHFYRDGEICLSILGTTEGPGWTPSLNLSTLCISIQSLMTENPYLDEGRCDHQVKFHNFVIRHETIRVAVLDLYEKRDSLPEGFCQRVEETFRQKFDFYVRTCTENVKSDGKSLKATHAGSNRTCCYAHLLKRFEELSA